MLQKMSTPELDEERGEGPPDEVGLGKDEKVTDEEEQEKGVGEGGEEEVEQKETERLQDEERVDEDTEMLQGNDAQETSKDISQVSTTLLIFLVTVGIFKIFFVFQRRLKTNASCLHSPYLTR